MNEALVEPPVNFLQLQQSLNDRGKKEQKYKIFGVIFFTVAVCSVIANPNDYIPGCEENSVACSYVPLWGFLASWTAMIIACASRCRQQHLAQQTAQQMEYFLQQISREGSKFQDAEQIANFKTKFSVVRKSARP